MYRTMALGVEASDVATDAFLRSLGLDAYDMATIARLRAVPELAEDPVSLRVALEQAQSLMILAHTGAVTEATLQTQFDEFVRVGMHAEARNILQPWLMYAKTRLSSRSTTPQASTPSSTPWGLIGVLAGIGVVAWWLTKK